MTIRFIQQTIIGSTGYFPICFLLLLYTLSCMVIALILKVDSLLIEFLALKRLLDTFSF